MAFMGYDSWDDYYEHGLIPNLWKGFTGQESADRNTDKAIEAQEEATKNELQWQKDKYAADLDFANRQLDWQKDVADKNFGLQQETFNYNKDINERQFAYQKDLNELQMAREDNAMQRQIADLTKAGFSPLAAIGGSGSAAGSLHSGAMNSLNAPQYDASGVGAAAGQYLDLARQYASLHQELNSKNADTKLGARMALAQMKADLNFKGQNMATQYFNAAVNAKNKKLQNESMQEDIKTKKYANDYYEKHGYQHVTLATVLSDFLNREDTKNAFNTFSTLIGNGLSSLAESINNIRNGSTTVYHELGEGAKKVIAFLGNDKEGNMKFSPSENNEILQDLSKQDKDKVFDWLKKNGRTLDSITLWDWMKIAEETK